MPGRPETFFLHTLLQPDTSIAFSCKVFQDLLDPKSRIVKIHISPYQKSQRTAIQPDSFDLCQFFLHTPVQVLLKNLKKLNHTETAVVFFPGYLFQLLKQSVLRYLFFCTEALKKEFLHHIHRILKKILFFNLFDGSMNHLSDALFGKRL